jgi:hypothetical protein
MMVVFLYRARQGKKETISTTLFITLSPAAKMGRLHVPAMNICSLDEATQFNNEKKKHDRGLRLLQGGIM